MYINTIKQPIIQDQLDIDNIYARQAARWSAALAAPGAWPEVVRRYVFWRRDRFDAQFVEADGARRVFRWRRAAPFVRWWCRPLLLCVLSAVRFRLPLWRSAPIAALTRPLPSPPSSPPQTTPTTVWRAAAALAKGAGAPALAPRQHLALLRFLCDEALDTDLLRNALSSRLDAAAEKAAALRGDVAEERKRLKELADAEKEERKRKRAERLQALQAQAAAAHAAAAAAAGAGGSDGGAAAAAAAAAAALAEQQQPERQQQQQQPAAPFVPDPPLEMADRAYVFVPAPAVTGFGGFWLKDPARTTPDPQPIDAMLGASKLAMRAHATIPGIWLQDSGDELTLSARPRSMAALGPLGRHVEVFRKDGAASVWAARRDVRVGRSVGQLFFTACGTLILRSAFDC